MPYKIDFKRIAEDTDIYAIAKSLGITVVKDRADCPVCKSQRGLQFFAETNSFQCHASGETRNSDCISLYAHIEGCGMYQAAKALQEQFGASASTAPQETAPRNQPGATSRPVPTFDAEEFASKLTYSSEVEDLGLSEADAKRYRVGMHRGKLYVPICPADTVPVAWAECSDGKFKLPSKWLKPQNVVPIRRKA